MSRFFFLFPEVRGFNLLLQFQKLEHQENQKLEKDMRFFFFFPSTPKDSLLKTMHLWAHIHNKINE